MAAVSPSYIEAIRTEEIIANGCFGTVYKGTDNILNRSFAIKAITEDLFLSANSVNAPTATKEAFLTEMKVRRRTQFTVLFLQCVRARERCCRWLTVHRVYFFLYASKRHLRSFAIQTLSHCMRMPFRTILRVVAILFVNLPRKDPWITFGRVVPWALNAFRCSAVASRSPWTL